MRKHNIESLLCMGLTIPYQLTLVFSLGLLIITMRILMTQGCNADHELTDEKEKAFCRALQSSSIDWLWNSNHNSVSQNQPAREVVRKNCAFID